MAKRFLSNINVNDQYTLPSADGTSGQIIQTDGSGNLSFVDFASDEARKIIFTVKNKDSISLSKGTVVHASPSATPPSGNVIEVIRADNDDSSKMPAIGVLNETLAVDAEGECVMLGSVSGIATNSFSIGDELYVSDTPGEFTNTKPTGTSNLIQKIAIVIKSHSTNGLIEVFGAGRSNDVPNQIDRNVNFTDNSVLSFGNDIDLNIYHASATDISFITRNGTLDIRANDLRLNSFAGESMIRGFSNGDVRLYYDSSEKLTTTSTGISVTGLGQFSNKILVADGSVSAPSYSFTSDTDTGFYLDGASIKLAIGGSNKVTIATSQTTIEETLIVNDYISADDKVIIEGDANPHLEIQDTTNERYTRLYSGDSESVLSYTNPTFSLRTGEFNGTVVFSVDSSRNVTFNNNVLPDVDSANDLGSTSLRWANVWADNINGGTPVNGGGTANDVVMWSDGDTLTDAPIAISGNNATFAGSIIVNSTGFTKGGHKISNYFATDAADGEILNLGVTGNIGYIQSLNGTTPNTLTFDGSSVAFRTGSFSTALTLDASQNATFAGDVTLSSGYTNITTDGSVAYGVLINSADQSHARLRINNTGTGGNAWSIMSGTSGVSNDGFAIRNETTTTTALQFTNSGNATFAGNVKIADEKILALRTSSNDYAIQYRDLDFRFIGSADSNTQRKFSFGYYTSDNPAGTWNGKVYINSYTGSVGIGTTSPLSGNKLDVRGGNIMVGGFGGGTDYGLILTPDDGSGYWNIANVTGGALTFNNSATIGSSEQMRLTTTGLGIGGTPVYNLDLIKSNAVSMIRTPDTTSPTLGLFVNSGSNGVGTISVDNGGHMTFDTGSTGAAQAERMRIDSSGNVIIGNTNVDNPNSLDKVLEIEHSGSVGLILNDSRDNPIGLENRGAVFHLTHNTNSRLVVNGASGNVGIGTTSPDEKLEVSGALSIKGALLDHKTNATTLHYFSNSGYLRAYGSSAGTGQLIFETGGGGGSTTTERMRIDSSGNVLIGATNSDIGGSVTGIRFNQAGTILASMDETADTTFVAYFDRRGTNNEGSAIAFAMQGFYKASIGVIGTSANVNDGGITFNTLATNGGFAKTERMRITSGGNINLGSGSLTQVSYQLRVDSDFDNGMYMSAGSSSGNYAMYIESGAGSALFNVRGDGNVGIGTTGPAGKLQVVNNSQSTSALTICNEFNGGDGFIFQRWQYVESTTSFRLDLKQRVTSGVVQYAFDMVNNGTAYNNNLVLDRGNVGIGTTSPGAKLDVNGELYVRNVIYAYAGAGNQIGGISWTSTDSGFLFAKTGNVTKVLLNSNGDSYLNGGNVIVGGTAVDTAGSTSLKSNGIIRGVLSSGTAESTLINAISGISNGFQLSNDASNNQEYIFHNGSSVSLKINSSGDILFGCTSLGNDFAYFEEASSNRRILNIGSSTTSSIDIVNFRNPNGIVGGINTDGFTTSFSSSSDYRLKENVVEMTDALDRVSNLKPSRFNFIGEEKTVDGFLAHEVQDIVPEAISGEKDAVDEKGNPIYQGIDQSKLVPLLVGAIQELQKRIEILENK
jgi:hypothetical protein